MAQNNSIFAVGCSCHIIHNTSHKATTMYMKYVKQFFCIIFAYITMLHLYICTYGLWPEIKFYYYYYKTVKINTPKTNGKTRATGKCFSTQEAGLLVMEQCPYIGATPDLFVQCECHGEGLCEIKCPYTMHDQIPSSARVLSNFIK